MSRPQLFILDADVLIDYVGSELRVLSLTARHVGPVHVARALAQEVEGLTESRCVRIGLQVVDPTLDQLSEAGEHRAGLSFQDRLCLILARDHEWICVTNDKRLRRECGRIGISVLWGLQLMVELVSLEEMSAADAIAVARKIQTGNPYHITPAIVARFVGTVTEAERER